MKLIEHLPAMYLYYCLDVYLNTPEKVEHSSCLFLHVAASWLAAAFSWVFLHEQYCWWKKSCTLISYGQSEENARIRWLKIWFNTEIEAVFQFGVVAEITSTKNSTKESWPGDLKWPFYSLFGGHDSPLKGSLFEGSPAELPGKAGFQNGSWKAKRDFWTAGLCLAMSKWATSWGLSTNQTDKGGGHEG